MKVQATQDGFCQHYRPTGSTFEIPDSPTRKLTKEDDAITRSIAIKGQVPCAFSSSWMRPAGNPVPIEEAPVQSHLKKPEDPEAIDVQSDVI